MLSWVEHVKSFITLGPGLYEFKSQTTNEYSLYLLRDEYVKKKYK